MSSTDAAAKTSGAGSAGSGGPRPKSGRVAAGDTLPGGARSLVHVVFAVPHLKGVVFTYLSLALAAVAGALAAGGSPLVVALCVAAGVLYWSLLEYLIHRFVLHWEPTVGWQRAIRRRINSHSGHHKRPERREAYVNPHLLIGLAVGLGFPPLLLLIGFPLPVALAIAAGSYVGYVLTEYLHAALHVLPMKGSAYARALYRFHAIHHYRDERYNHAVVFPPWDYVFGSAFRPRRARARRAA